MLFTLILALPFLSLSLGAPAPLPLFGIHINSGPSTNAKTTAIAAKMVDSQLVRPALFSRLAYCSAAKTKSLTCGAPCDAVKGISVVTAGGDDGKVPGCKDKLLLLSQHNLTSQIQSSSRRIRLLRAL